MANTNGARKMKIYWDLFAAFFKIGLFTFGGGYAMLPLIQKEVVKKTWVTEEEVLDYYAIGQVTPGIIAVNVSTFIGYKIKGWSGAICTMIGMTFPSLCIITALAMGLSYFWDSPIVSHAFAGIRLVIPALIVPILIQMLKKSLVNKFSFLIVIFAFSLSFFNILAPIYITFLSGLLGLFYQIAKEKHL